MLDNIAQIAITLLGATAILLIAKKNKWGFVVGLISQPFWFITSLAHKQWGIFITSIIFTINWIYGIYEWFYKNNKNIPAQQAYELIKRNKNNSNFIILDVRTLDEFKKGHLKNSLLIDFYSKNFKEELKRLDKEKIYLIYCRSGRRSKEALGIMKKIKFKEIYNMRGGIIAWRKNNYPITK